MSEDIRRRLYEAARAGEVIRVIYLNGSQPGTVREIAPISITDEDVRANCIATDEDKSYKIEGLRLADDSTAINYNPDGPPAPETQSVEVAVAPHIDRLKEFGWHVDLSTDRISLHLFFKNGKPRKGYVVVMGFSEFTADIFDDGDGKGLQAIERPSKRPYYISSSELPTRTFTRLPGALNLFMTEASRLAPKRVT